MKYLTTYLLAATILIGELHTFWERSSLQVSNWIIFRYVPMSLQWNIKFAADELNPILYFIAFLLYGKYPNRVNKTTVKTFIWFCTIDAGLYFLNWKTFSYGYMYVALIIIWFVTYHWKYKKKRQ